MADTTLPNSRVWMSLDRMRTAAGIVSAVVGAVMGMWGIYEKLKSDARAYTTTSYETLAPQLNQMNEALRQMQQDNQKLRQALAVQSPGTREGRRPAVVRPRPEPAASAKPGAPAPAAPTQSMPAEPAPAASVPAPPPAPATTAEEKQGRVDEILGTVGRAREAVDNLRKVPESFKEVLERKQKLDQQR